MQTATQAQILSRPTVTRTALPEEMKDHFAGEGKELVLIYAHSMNVSQNRAYGRYPVLFSELPESLKRIAKMSFDNPQKNDDLLLRGDCVLVAQSIEERDAWRGDAEARLIAQESNEDIGDAINELNDGYERAGGKALVSLDASRVPAVRDHVKGGEELAAMVAEQDARKAEAKEKQRKL